MPVRREQGLNSYLFSVVWQFAVFGLMVIAAVTARGHGSVLYSPGSRGGGFGGNFSHDRLNHGFSERLIRPSHGQIEMYDRRISLALIDRFRVMNATSCSRPRYPSRRRNLLRNPFPAFHPSARPTSHPNLRRKNLQRSHRRRRFISPREAPGYRLGTANWRVPAG